MNLSKRLKCVADCVTKGNRVADIGCDHAFTSIYLINEHLAPFVLATDVNEGPLKTADRHIQEAGLSEYIETRRTDGLTDISPDDEIETILISGMGGNLIIDILNTNRILINSVKEIILQPQSDVYKVRHFLHDNGFLINFEKMIYEEGKYYVVIKAVKGCQSFQNEFEYTYGKYLIEKPDDIFMQYARAIINSNDKIIKQLTMQQGNHQKRLDELYEENEILRSIIEKNK